MNASELDRLMRIIESGRADELSPTEVARLESVLNSDATLADLPARRVPRVDPRMSAAVAELSSITSPDAEMWEHVWERIESESPIAASAVTPSWNTRLLRLWRPLSAAAACLLLGIIWRLGTPAPRDAWPLEIAGDVEIEALEVYGDALPFVVTLGGDHPTEMVWVLEGTESEG